MNTQLTMDYSKKATERGIKKAVDHANQVHSQWSDTAYDFLRIYLRHHRNWFMVEDVRQQAAGVVPEAPSKRAWGGIILRAVREGLVRKVGIQSVKNTTAHRANAAVWKRV